jgi:hypothetical protein
MVLTKVCSRCNSLKIHRNASGDFECSTCGYIEKKDDNPETKPDKRRSPGTAPRYHCKICGVEIRLAKERVKPEGNYCIKCRPRAETAPNLKVDIVWGYMVASQGQDDKERAKRLIEIMDYISGRHNETS